MFSAKDACYMHPRSKQCCHCSMVLKRRILHIFPFPPSEREPGDRGSRTGKSLRHAWRQ